MASLFAGESKRKLIVYGFLFLAGLFFRIYLMSAYGMYDMSSYIAWGQSANQSGLAEAYTGTYFPIQWQSFQLSDFIARTFDIAPHKSVKGVSFLFEIGTFCMLVVMLKAYGRNPAWALMFWCHPFFLSIWALGYIDIQYCFFVLMTIFLAERSKTWFSYSCAGIPLGIAFLMKPQVEVLILAGAIFLVFNGILQRDWKPFALTIAPAFLFILYSSYFYLNGLSIFALLESDIRIANVMPMVSANMMNPWLPLGQYLSEYSTGGSDLHPLLGPLSIRHAAIGATVFCYAYQLAKKDPDSNQSKYIWLYLLAYSALILPMVMTSAHENHGYLASILLVLVTTSQTLKMHHVAIQVFMFAQFVNLTGLYRMGNDSEPKGNMAFWTSEAMLAVSIVSSLCFLFILQFYFFILQDSEQSRSLTRAAVPVFGLVAIFSVIYSLAMINI